jgi:hypothetical protein
MPRTFYDVLGVSSRATPDAIKVAFRKKAQMVHPDKVQAQVANLDPYAAERLKKALEEDFRDLKEAYDVLSNTRQRKEYDDLLKQVQATSAPPAQPSPPPPAPPPAKHCTFCGATLVGNSCPDCTKPRGSGVLVNAAGAFLLALGALVGVLLAFTVPQENSWDPNTCLGILVVLGILVFWAVQKGVWGGIKRVRKTRPVLLAFVVEMFAFIVLALAVGVYNAPQKATSTPTPAPTQTASLPLTIAPARPPDCRQMIVRRDVGFGAHTYSVGRPVCVTASTNGKYFYPQDNVWFDESDLGAVATASQTVPKKSAARGLTGLFGGTVKNETAGQSADVGIDVKDNDGALSGCMVVKPPLYGSGPLSGSVNGSDVTFTVLSSIGGISFTGQREGGTLHGTYTVRHLSGSSSEIGTFVLQKSESAVAGLNFDGACSKSQPQATPTAVTKSQREPSTLFSKLPLHWRYASTNAPTDIWLDERSFYEKSTTQSTKPGAAVKIETTCIVPRGDSFPWTGSCTYQYYWSDASGVFKGGPLCTVNTVEKITSISTTAISGQSQKVDVTPLQSTPSKCPIPGVGITEFALVPGLIAKSDQASSDKPEAPQAPCSEMVIVKSNYVLSINRPYPTSYSNEPIDASSYSVGDHVTVTTKRNGRYFHPTDGGDGEWFNASDLRCPEKP